MASGHTSIELQLAVAAFRLRRRSLEHQQRSPAVNPHETVGFFATTGLPNNDEGKANIVIDCWISNWLKLIYRWQELVDEHAQGILSRISSRLAAAVDLLREHITRQELLAVASVVGTVLFILAVGYVMTYLV